MNATVKSWLNPKSRNKRQFESYEVFTKALSIYFISIWLFPLLLYALLKRCNLPCMKILSDSCNGIWLSSWGWHFQRRHCAATDSAELTGQEGTVIRRTYLPRSHLSYPLRRGMIWQSINRPPAKQESKSLGKESVHDVIGGLISAAKTCRNEEECKILRNANMNWKHYHLISHRHAPIYPYKWKKKKARFLNYYFYAAW